MRPRSQYIGTVPAGTKIIRQANIKDHIEDTSRVVLVEHPDGSQHWLHVPVFGRSPAMTALDVLKLDGIDLSGDK